MLVISRGRRIAACLSFFLSRRRMMMIDVSFWKEGEGFIMPCMVHLQVACACACACACAFRGEKRGSVRRDSGMYLEMEWRELEWRRRERDTLIH